MVAMNESVKLLDDAINALKSMLPVDIGSFPVPVSDEARKVISQLPDHFGYSKSALARKIGVSTTTFHRFFREKYLDETSIKIRRETITRIIAAFKFYIETNKWEGDQLLENDTGHSERQSSNTSGDSKNKNSSVVWVLTEKKTISVMLAMVSESLAELVTVLKSENSLTAPDGLLSDFQKRALISILEVALVELKGPIVDSSRLGTIGKTLRRIFERAVEKEATERVQEAIKDAEESVLDFVDASGAIESTRNLTDIF